MKVTENSNQEQKKRLVRHIDLQRYAQKRLNAAGINPTPHLMRTYLSQVGPKIEMAIAQIFNAISDEEIWKECQQIAIAAKPLKGFPKTSSTELQDKSQSLK